TQTPHTPLLAIDLLGDVLRHVGEDLHIEDVRSQRPFAEMSLESFESDFDPDRPERRALRARAEEHVVGDDAERLLDRRPLGDIAIERALHTDRLRVRARLPGKLFHPPRDAPQPDRVLAENLLQLRARETCELASGSDADSLAELRGLRPAAADFPA